MVIVQVKIETAIGSMTTTFEFDDLHEYNEKALLEYVREELREADITIEVT